MSLMDTIANDLISAMKSGEKEKLLILRMVKSAVKNTEIEKGDPLNDDEVSAVLRTFAKRAKDSIEQFSQGGREELAEKEKTQLAIIEEYLPKQLGEDRHQKLSAEALMKVHGRAHNSAKLLGCLD